MSIDNNNIICDGMNSSLSPNEASVKLVCDIDQIYPIGTICKINLTN